MENIKLIIVQRMTLIAAVPWQQSDGNNIQLLYANFRFQSAALS